MKIKKNVFVIIGSASNGSANYKLINYIAALTIDEWNITICDDLKKLPHFDPELSIDNTPASVIEFRQFIETADGVIICTPEYVFSIPSGLKNAIEWCVSTTVFSDKPVGLITASASGIKGHEELQLIMKTIMAVFTEETTLLIRGVKGKINENGEITDKETKAAITRFITSFKEVLDKQ
ncbi:MAG TPA: NADPH-dependent FMN reductase [Flavisolibacter sp.]|nr:NADPH-dependent FMN reductase [Flavisolibacter sp.]